MANDDGFKKAEILCKGFVILTGNKKGVEYIILSDDGKETSDRMVFSINKNTKGYAGSVYSCEVSDTSVRCIEFTRTFEDSDRRAVLMARSQANQTAHQAYIQQKKDQTDDTALLEMLRPLREIYHSTNHLGRSALIARVILYMQKKY